MTMEERIAKIQRIKESRENAIEMAKISMETKVKRLINKINDIQPRIGEILTVAGQCYKNEINIKRFESSGITHNLGFLKLKSESDNYSTYSDLVLAIQAGGACGDWGLEVNRFGMTICKNDKYVMCTYSAYLEKCKDIRIVSSRWDKVFSKDFENTYLLERFLNEFDEFENNFYNYIDNLEE